MTVVLIVGFFILVFYGVWEKREDLGRIVSQWERPGGIGFFSGLSGAFFLGLSNAPNGITLCSVSQKLEKQSDSISVGIISFIINSLCFIGCTALILPFTPSILGEPVPNLFIINNHLAGKIPPYEYRLHDPVYPYFVPGPPCYHRQRLQPFRATGDSPYRHTRLYYPAPADSPGDPRRRYFSRPNSLSLLTEQNL